MSNKPLKKVDENKAWNKRKTSKSPYNIDSKEVRKSFLIICEGENTEPEYFKSFPVVTASVEAIGYGASKMTLVNKAIALSKREEHRGKEVWVVFDFDVKPDQEGQKEDFNNAIRLAKSKNLKVAYSNDAFELWLVLHYKSIAAKFTRREYYEMLSEIWGVNYEKVGKEKRFASQIYERLKSGNQEQAIEAAKRLLEEKIDEPYADQNPCTTIFELVRELNEYLKI
jgi:hypothetical protein